MVERPTVSVGEGFQHTCMHLWAGVCLFTGIWKSEVNVDICLCLPPLYFLGTESLTESCAHQIAKSFRELSPPQHQDYKNMLPHPIFVWVLRI